MSILVIAEHDNTSIRPSTLNTVAAAKLLGDDIHLFVATNNSELPNSASTIEGISKVISSVDDTLEHQLPEALAPMIKEVATSYSHVLAPATTFGKNLMPRASALLDSQQISDISGVIDQDTLKDLFMLEVVLPQLNLMIPLSLLPLGLLPLILFS